MKLEYNKGAAELRVDEFKKIYVETRKKQKGLQN